MSPRASGRTSTEGPLTVHWYGQDDAAAPTLVLLHGLTDSGRCWGDAVSRWAGKYRMAAIDALGHGGSPRFSSGQLNRGPMEAMVESTLEAVEDISSDGRQRPVLIGHSMGAGVAAAVAVRAPALIKGVVLEDPAWFDPGDWDVQQAAHWNTLTVRRFRADLQRELANGRAEHPGWPESEMYEWALAKTECDDAFLATGLAALSVPYSDVAGALDVPSLVVCGSRQVFVDTAKQAILTSLGNSKLEIHVISGAGHCVRRDRSQAYHNVVDPWIRQTTLSTLGSDKHTSRGARG